MERLHCVDQVSTSLLTSIGPTWPTKEAKTRSKNGLYESTIHSIPCISLYIISRQRKNRYRNVLDLDNCLFNDDETTKRRIKGIFSRAISIDQRVRPNAKDVT